MTSSIILAYLLQSVSVLTGSTDFSMLDPVQVKCLAENIYYEAGGEDLKGKYAVASVTVNRAEDNRFPDTVCDVVKQKTFVKNIGKHICAFSWFCDNSKNKDISFVNKDGSINERKKAQFEASAIVAIKVLGSDVPDVTKGAKYFHNATVLPSWALTQKKTVVIGNHTFYK